MERRKSSSSRMSTIHQNCERKIPQIPLEHLIAFHSVERPSKLIGNVLEEAKYPPLMQPKSWTKAVPFKVS